MANAFTEAASGLFGNIFNASFGVIIGLIVFLIVAGIMYYFFFYRRKFDILIKLISDRASDPRIKFDYAAIFTDKDKSKYLRLLDTRVDLPSPPFKIMEKTNKGDYLEIWRKSDDEFIYLITPHIDKERWIKTDGKIYPISQEYKRQIEPDWHWIVMRKEKDKKLITPETILGKILENLHLIIPGAFMVIILIIFVNKLPTILDQLQQLVTQLHNTQAVVHQAQ